MDTDDSGEDFNEQRARRTRERLLGDLDDIQEDLDKDKRRLMRLHKRN
jgi:hypothetical protein